MTTKILSMLYLIFKSFILGKIRILINVYNDYLICFLNRILTMNYCFILGKGEYKSNWFNFIVVWTGCLYCGLPKRRSRATKLQFETVCFTIIRRYFNLTEKSRTLSILLFILKRTLQETKNKIRVVCGRRGVSVELSDRKTGPGAGTQHPSSLIWLKLVTDQTFFPTTSFVRDQV